MKVQLWGHLAAYLPKQGCKETIVPQGHKNTQKLCLGGTLRPLQPDFSSSSGNSLIIFGNYAGEKRKNEKFEVEEERNSKKRNGEEG
jgi:hypothetical protein